MRVKNRFVSLVIAMLATTFVHAADLAQTKAAMEGVWRLTEWQTEEALLRPPQVDGRFSIHDGAITVMMHRDLQGERKSNYGYGSYTLTSDTWSYGFDRYVIFTDKSGNITTGPGPFEGQRVFQIKNQDGKLALDHDNGRWMFIFDGDNMTYLDKGKPVRKWQRMPKQ